MEEASNNEVEELKLEASESLKEENTQGEDNANNEVQDLKLKTSESLKEENTQGEVITNNEVQDLKLKTSESLKEENTQGEITVINSNTFQQDQLQKLEESSLDDPAKVNKVKSSEIKPKLSDDSGEKGMEINASATETGVHSVVKTDESTLSVTGKLYKEVVTKDESANYRMKTNLSKISVNSEIVSINDSNKINYSMPIHSTVQIKCSSSSTENQVQTHSSAEYFEQYKVFPKSVPSSVNVNPNLIIVKFECENVSFTSAFDMTTTVEEIKNRLCYLLKLEEDFIDFHYNNIETKDSQTLAALGAEPHGKVVFKVFSKNGDGGNKQLIAKIEENIPTIDVITVHINEGEYYRDIVVEITNENIQKQWLGGYRNKLTGTDYHNADTQTLKKKKVFEIDEASGEKIPLFFNRDTQTPFPLVQKTVDTVVDKATQMSRSDLYINSNKDKIISSHIHGKRELMSFRTNKCSLILKCVIMIQRAVRKWIMRKRFLVLVKTQIEQLQKFKRYQQQIFHDQEDKDRAVITGAVYPVNRDDFYALFLIVEKWWKKEWKKICETKRSEPKKAVSVMLVEEETKLLEAIEKHKAASKAESLKKEEMRFLEQISRPLLFRTSKGHLTTIDYLETQKAREFKEIYSALTRKDVLPKDRIEMLIAMKNLFELHYEAYEYAKDLVSLINREIELIGIGFKLSDLRGLQSRIEQLFLNFLQQPEFNPSAKKYKKSNLPKTLHQTFQCSRCLKLLPASKYPVHVRMRAFTQCKSCTWMENIAHKRADMSPYLKLLHQVQNSEMQKCCHSAICFILQPIGMGHLTNVIWHGQSAISECSDISKLHHVRWLPDVEWAPWNTILLTDQEAKLHESIPDIFTFYDEKLIERVRQKHILARKRFIPLLMMDHDIRSTGQWSKITDSGIFLHPSHAERMANENPEYDAI